MSARIAGSVAALALCACADRWPKPLGEVGFGETTCIATGLPDRAAIEADLDLLVDLGVRWVRYELSWQAVERSRGVYDLSPWDSTVDLAAARGIRTLVILAYGNTLYSVEGGARGDDKYPPDAPEPFGAYARAVARHFGGRVDAYEVWNEQNGGIRFFKPEADPVRYAHLLLQASRAIREECPACRVLFGGTFWHQVGTLTIGAPAFTRDALAVAGVPEAIDGMATHPYMLYPPCAPPEYTRPQPCGFFDLPYREVPVPTMLDEVIAADGAHPLYVTEVGWPTIRFDDTPQRTVTDEEQAAWMVRSIVYSAVRDSRITCWFTLRDGPNTGGFPPEEDFGLLAYHPDRTQARRKRAFDAYKDLSAALGPLRYAGGRTAEVGSGAHAYVFADAKRAVTVAWAEEGVSRRVKLERLGGRATVRAVGGAAAEVGGDLAIDLGPMPVLVEESR